MKRSLIFIYTALCCVAAFPQIFFKVSGGDLKEPSYLFGTHHLAPLTVIERVGADSILPSVKGVVGEVELSGNALETAQIMQSYMIAPPDSVINNLLSENDLEHLKVKFMELTDTKVFPEYLLQFKPVALSSAICMSVVSKQMEFNPAEQLDTYFQTYALHSGMELAGLEGIEDQAEALFNAAPISVQLTELMEMIEWPDKLAEEAKELNEAYMRQDKQLFAKLYQENSEKYRDQFDKLLTQRNARWMAKLPDLLRKQSSFVAVGYMHLVGKDGLVEQLKDCGYTVSPLGFVPENCDGDKPADKVGK